MRALPTMLTLGNALLGVSAMVLAYHGQITTALYLILLGAILDFADGWVARRLGVESPAGAWADVLGDAVSFGVAPSVLIFLVMGGWGILLLALLYTGAILYRLHRFRRGPELDRLFIGMPSPATALAVAAGAVIAYENPELRPVAVGAVLLFTGLAVSRIRYPKWSHPSTHSLPGWANILIYGGHGLAFLFEPGMAMLSLMIVYTFLGPYLFRKHSLALERSARAEGSQA